jgi:hypothetical protein
MNKNFWMKCCHWQSMPTGTLSIPQSRSHLSLTIMAICLEYTCQLQNPCTIWLLRAAFSRCQVFLNSDITDSKKPGKRSGNPTIRQPILHQYRNQVIWLCSVGRTSKSGDQKGSWMQNSMVYSKSWRRCHQQHLGWNDPHNGEYIMPFMYPWLSPSASPAIEFEICQTCIHWFQMNLNWDRMSKDMDTRQDMR